jgi:hypothetical protein
MNDAFLPSTLPEPGKLSANRNPSAPYFRPLNKTDGPGLRLINECLNSIIFGNACEKTNHLTAEELGLTSRNGMTSPVKRRHYSLNLGQFPPERG